MRAARPQIRYPSRPSGPMPSRPRTPNTALALAMVSAFAMALLAGCTSGAGGGESNTAPHAVLEVDDDNAYTGDDITFDAQGSTDSDGEITKYVFDFGDGTPPMEVTEEDAARVTHVYLKGGEYTVTLTVTDDGKDNTGALTDTESENIIVNERVRISQMAFDIGDANETSEQEQVFKVYQDANRFDLNVTLRSALPTGSSEFKVRVEDPEGDVLAEKTESVGAGTTGKVVTLDGLLTKEGDHMVVIEAVSGGGTADGEIRIIYGEDVGG